MLLQEPEEHTTDAHVQHQHNYTGCNSAMSNKAVEV